MNKLFFWFLLFTVFVSVRAAFQDRKVAAERSADAAVRLALIDAVTGPHQPTPEGVITDALPTDHRRTETPPTVTSLWSWPAQLCALASEMPNALLWFAFGTGIMVVVCIAWAAWRIAADKFWFEGWHAASEMNIHRALARQKRREELGLDEPLQVSEIDAQRNALAEARLRIAQLELIDWPGVEEGYSHGMSRGLQQARHIIGSLFDEIPIKKPQRVVQHEMNIAQYKPEAQEVAA